MKLTLGATVSRMGPTVLLPMVRMTFDLLCTMSGNCRGWDGSRMKRAALFLLLLGVLRKTGGY